MTITIADWHDILPVLHETYRIWSPGLTKSTYQQYAWGQLSHAWSRHNFRYVVHKEGSQPAASCKLYNLTMASRGRDYRVLGIGAVYTLESFRSRGLAHQLIDDVIELAEDQGYDGLILYSEIDPEFYEQFGFVELGAADFGAHLPGANAPPQPLDQCESVGESRTNSVMPAPGEKDIPWLARHYARWLRTQPYGIARSETYWRYKLSKERFLHNHSRLAWPQLQLTALDNDSNDAGYMLTEQGGATIRVLEIAGSQKARRDLWVKLLQRAKDIGATRIRGWESGIVDLAPGFSLSQITSGEQKLDPIQYTQRDWGCGMLLALCEELESWHAHFPCPLLELDLV